MGDTHKEWEGLGDEKRQRRVAAGYEYAVGGMELDVSGIELVPQAEPPLWYQEWVERKVAEEEVSEEEAAEHLAACVWFRGENGAVYYRVPGQEAPMTNYIYEEWTRPYDHEEGEPGFQEMHEETLSVLSAEVGELIQFRTPEEREEETEYRRQVEFRDMSARRNPGAASRGRRGIPEP